MIQVPVQAFYVFVLIFLRVAFLFTFFPILGEAFLPLRVRILVCAAISVALAGVVPVNAGMFPADWPGLARLTLTEAALGFGLAFIGRMMFAIVQYSGQLIGQEIGFGMVNAVDPSQHQSTAMAELLYIGSILLFFGVNMHHVLLGALVDSFSALPPGSERITKDFSGFLLGLGSSMFSLAISFAMPVVAMNFSLNAAMGMVGRAVPQLNVFVESFPVRIIAGLSVILLCLGYMAGLWLRMFGDMGSMMRTVIGSMR